MIRKPSHQKKERYYAIDADFKSIKRSVKDFCGEKGLAEAGLKKISIPSKHTGIRVLVGGQDVLLGSLAASEDHYEISHCSGTIQSLIDGIE